MVNLRTYLDYNRGLDDADNDLSDNEIEMMVFSI